MFLCMTPKTKIWVEHRGTYIGGFAWWRGWDIEVNYLTNTCNRLWFVSRPLRLFQWYQYPTTLVREWERLSRVGLNKGASRCMERYGCTFQLNQLCFSIGQEITKHLHLVGPYLCVMELCTMRPMQCEVPEESGGREYLVQGDVGRPISLKSGY